MSYTKDMKITKEEGNTNTGPALDDLEDAIRALNRRLELLEYEVFRDWDTAKAAQDRFDADRVYIAMKMNIPKRDPNL